MTLTQTNPFNPPRRQPLASRALSPSSLGDLIKTSREAQGILQRDLAKSLNAASSTLCLMEAEGSGWGAALRWLRTLNALGDLDEVVALVKKVDEGG